MSEIYQCPPPNAIQIEPVEGCSLACWFCALQVLRDNGADRDSQTHGKSSSPYLFMTLETAERIASEIARAGWIPRIEFAMHGEPTMSKQLPAILAIFRKHNPKASLMVTCNGGGLTTGTFEKIQAMFDAGLNSLVFDDYKHADFVPKIRPFLALLDMPVYEYPLQKDEANPHQKFNGRRVIIIQDISINTTGSHQLSNQGGSSGSHKENIQRRCAKPFRELSFRWDGNVALCCDDWPGKYKIGNIHDMPLEELWNHPRFDAARRRLYQKDRSFGPCNGCTVKTPRDGILPDKQGVDEMPLPDAESHKHLVDAMRGQPFTPLIKRTKFQSSLNDMLQ
jgi:radical SAM protein with 4Fe4S-binding SPASM domain